MILSNYVNAYEIRPVRPNWHTLLPIVNLGHPDWFDLFKHKNGPFITTTVELHHADPLDIVNGFLWLSHIPHSEKYVFILHRDITAWEE